jgi:hypothetical protein
MSCKLNWEGFHYEAINELGRTVRLLCCASSKLIKISSTEDTVRIVAVGRR